ncbi:MAG TPA: hypothetical protein PLD20_16850 [Blastocatellia bacterium]|nr:hypothetical protein [Blastocatellia bacterium]HMY70247.1 hypothetical protein [Blastocatellia bacterium]HMZ19607.1 hypothetical protein [Blastocatellia bacterium]HNG32169.1 hypothetical protein [Blastocatellia bacterium]
MDCRNFKELLDSYLCQELAVETNHAMLSHAEHCSPCRIELASRRNLRQALRRVCAEDRMSDDACRRLRALLQAEAAAQETVKAGWKERLGAMFKLPLARPAMAMVAVLVLVVGGFALFRWQNLNRVSALQLSEELMTDAAADHNMCAPYAKGETLHISKPETFMAFDEACLGLEDVLKAKTVGMELRSAHVCGLKDGRRFAHLIYKRDQEMVSLLVTPRDQQAMKLGQLPDLDTKDAGIQETHREELSIGAYQTAKRVVLVVSRLPNEENEKLAQTLALPVVAHLRQIEGQRAFLQWPRTEVIAIVKGGELK